MEIITTEQRDALNEVALLLCKNTQDEAEATAGYQKQLAALTRAMELVPGASVLLSKIFEATEEKIADELNHAHSLLAEYEELTGIMPAKE